MFPLAWLDRAVIHLGELLYEAAQAEWAARESQSTKRAVASVEPRSARRRRGRQQAVAPSEGLFIGTENERDLALSQIGIDIPEARAGLDSDECSGAGCEGPVGVPEPEHCALEEGPVAQSTSAAGPTGQITFVKGDATKPIDILDTGHSVVACNDVGQFGAGFAGSVARRWKAAQDAYFRWHQCRRDTGILFFQSAYYTRIRVKRTNTVLIRQVLIALGTSCTIDRS